MKLGFIINGENPLLQTILPSDISSVEGSKPLLIVGAEKACELFPDFSFESKTISESKRIYYCFSELEAKEKYEEALNNFISYCFSFHIKDFKIINVYNIEELKTDAKRAFVYETNVFITITTDTEIFYINKEIYNFIHKENFTSELIKSSNRIELISWDKYNYFGSYLKPSNQYINIRDFKKIFFKDLSVIYLGALCLKWLNELDNINSNERSLWQRAYYIENYLSNVKIKINAEKLKSYAANETNTLMQTIYSNSYEGYISQGYNGTDKITGRMYVLDSGFSLQTLPPKFKDFIIAALISCAFLSSCIFPDSSHLKQNQIKPLVGIRLIGKFERYRHYSFLIIVHIECMHRQYLLEIVFTGNMMRHFLCLIQCRQKH
jgi:hypothetical protein